MGKIGTLYFEEDTFLHKLDSGIKFILFMVWTIITFMFLDIRIFACIGILGIILLYKSKIPFKTIKIMVGVMIGFNLLNSLFILLITPQYGSKLTGTYTYIIDIGYSVITLESLFYVLTLSLKYATLLPITLIFIFTTHPSKFASSLNKMGVPYKIAYALNIAFRYIPDIQKEFNQIVNSQQARGISFKKGEASVSKRVKNFTAIIMPLITSALKRIEVVSNAMDLRGFGKHNSRTWYNYHKINKMDYLVLSISLICLLTSIYIKLNMNFNLWYPF
ncbi:energy-coupling factor transporter transmembrane component T family protein [Tepidibacter hydrothermalis]|uniref:Energy-coupling factor transporter transmembrane component T n=1 Tax=Tepidibacter hydrothermalis TaxID=3036126 RepID=A0ABY8EGU7_9FIRM|nr:energy-coupling factor transporter transmembrane component T [Tepidibacter hydrothermalis]WFD12172.1 energy-coupling factor transporter transmembrane component T [Tepidibacter hydrothermalis]